MPGEIVKYNNNLNISLKNFKSTEMDLLMVLFSKVKEQGTKEVAISFSDIKTLAGYKATALDRFVNDLSSTNRKLMGLQMEYEEDDNVRYQFVLFPTFGIDEVSQTLTVEVNSKFAYLLNNMSNNFTRFELEEFRTLRSVYSKSLYRFLKQWRSVGSFSCTLERFKEILDIPENYTVSNINARVMKPIMEELPAFFKNFTVTKNFRKASAGKGRPVLDGYIFSFTPERRGFELSDGLVQETGFICPECGEPLVERVINGDNCWCHLNGWMKDAPCHRIFNTISEIRELESKMVFADEPKTERNGKAAAIGSIMSALYSARLNNDTVDED